MPKIPTFKPRSPACRTYRPKPTEASDGANKPRVYNSRSWRGTDKKQGCRDVKLRQDPLCERCRLAGKAVPATDVHHRVDVADEPSLAYDLANLESLCHECHSRETMRRLKAKPCETNPQR